MKKINPDQRAAACTISFRLPPEIEDRLYRLCAKLGKKRAILLRQAIEEYLDRNDKPVAKRNGH